MTRRAVTIRLNDKEWADMWDCRRIWNLDARAITKLALTQFFVASKQIDAKLNAMKEVADSDRTEQLAEPEGSEGEEGIPAVVGDDAGID